MTLLVTLVLGLVAAATAALLVARAWWHRPGRVDRVRLVSDAVQLVLLLLLVRVALPWPGLLSWAWVLLAAALAAGVVGTVVSWPDLPWTADRRRRDGTVQTPATRPAQVRSLLWLLVGAGVAAVLL